MAGEIAYARSFLTSRNGQVLIETPVNYQVARVIDEGTQGIVVEAWDQANARRLAIKKVKESYFSTAEGVKQCYREFVLGAAVQHDNIIRIRHAYSPQTNWYDFRELYLVFDYMNYDLAQLNFHRRDIFSGSNGANHIAILMRQLLCAVKHLHLEKLRLIHRDIKPSNILIRDEGENRFHLKLADLGSARQLPPDDDEMISRYVVTRPYRAPEIILTDSYERAVDLWSVGCVLAELMINKILFDERDSLMLVYCIMQYVGVSQDEIQALPEFVRQNVLQNPQRFTTNHLETYLRKKSSQWPSSSTIGIDQLIDLTQRLLVFNPEHRISAEQALALPMWTPMGNSYLCEGSKEGVYVEDTQHRSFEQWKQVLYNQLQLYNIMVPQ